MAIAIASALAKDMAGEPLFRDVSFKLEARDRLTLSGRNGSGKTTLLRMLAGQSSIDGGELVLGKGIRVALHDQRPPRERDLTLRDYALSGREDLLAVEARLAELEQAMADGAHDQATLVAYSNAQGTLDQAGGYAWRERALASLRGLGFGDDDLDRALATFSGGELTRASLGRVLAGEPDLLLLDEPTNHLDIASLEWLEKKLVSLDAAVVLVAHDRWFLEAVGTAVLELERGRARFFAGSWHAWRKEQAARDLAAGRASARQQAEIERLERFVTRFRAGTRARQAQSRVKHLEKMERPDAAPRAEKSLGFAFKPPGRSGRVVFELEGGQIGVAGRTLLSDAELWLERGEHVSLVGPNGTGKTTLLHTLAGGAPLERGKLRRGHNVELGLLSQHAEELDETGSVLEAAGRATGLTPNRTRALLGQFLFSGAEAEKPVAGLSGGERRRLSLAVLMHSGANVLVLDEPTNHLDLESREALEEALRGYQGAVLLVTHDRALLDAVGTRTVAVEDGTLRSYEGGWAEYLRLREERERAGRASSGGSGAKRGGARKNGSGGKNGASARAGNGPSPAQSASSEVAPRSEGSAGADARPRSKNARRNAERLEREIAEAEAALAALEEELSDPSAWEGPERSAASAARHEQAREVVRGLYERYEAVAS
ncbi:MAG: ABC-F family ATP-binding cassette domain-containing protein [Thermoleophilaceae bacterium]